MTTQPYLRPVLVSKWEYQLLPGEDPEAKYPRKQRVKVPDGEGILHGFFSELADGEQSTVGLVERPDGTLETVWAPMICFKTPTAA